MKTILNNKWHLHFAIASWVMCVLLFIFTFEDTLGPIGKYSMAMVLLFFGCAIFEWNQSRRIPTYEKPSMKVMAYDVLAGLAGGLAFIIAYQFGFSYTYLFTISIVGIVLQIYKTLK